MTNPNIPLIVGAGPVGLAAGLFLAKHGIAARIIDALPAPATTSRALAVNPRTLDLLEATGVTAEMLKRGLPIREILFWRGNSTPASISIEGIHPRYPMLALSQAATESLLFEALQKYGGSVERENKLMACRQDNGSICATIETRGTASDIAPAWLLAADGSRSTVRHQLNLGFNGSSFPEMWHLTDVPLTGDMQKDAAHIRFFDDGGFLFLLPVIDDIRKPRAGDQVWRIIGNFSNLFDRLPNAKPSGPPIWESQFHVAHRIAPTLNPGNIYLAGDAAHIHSPMGARGMNLGIEDAWVFAELMKAGRASRYGTLRHAIDQRVVKRVEMMTTLVRGQSAFTRFIRRIMFPCIPHISLLRRQMLKTGSGLDHKVTL